MPTKRQRVGRHRHDDPRADPALWAVLSDTPVAEGECDFIFDLATIEPAWREHGPAIVADWIEERPGARPTCWWRFDAPGPRLHLGGKGTPAAGVLAHAPRIAFGIPCDWVADHWIARGVKAERFHASNPPAYESQAAYLTRLNLLLPGEARRLPAHALDPEILPAELWPD